MTAAVANSTTTGTLPANTTLRVLGDSIVTITRDGAFVASQSTARDNFVGPYPVDSSYSVVAGDAAIDISLKDNSGTGEALVPAMLTTDDNGSTVLEGADGSFLIGPMVSGTWMRVPTVFRLRMVGTGTVTLDAKDALGNITTDIAVYTISGATDRIEFPYAGDSAVAIRATLTGDTTVEVI